MADRVYLDWNATTPLRAEAKHAMVAALDLVGNPSSVHGEGRAARKLVEAARQELGRAADVDAAGIIFTSGGTEANALALQPSLRRSAQAGPCERLIVSAIEHASVLAGGRFTQDMIEIAPVTNQGVVDLDALSMMLKAGPPALVSVMLANNETGVIQPIPAIAALVRETGGVLHVDAVQALGKMSVDVRPLGADLVSVSAHKLGGPKGVGALLLGNPDLQGLAAALRGGGQERSRRAGTENVAGIAGFGAAIAATREHLADEAARMDALRTRLEQGLRAQGAQIVIFGDAVPRLPNTTCLAVPGMRAETALIALDLAGIAASSGSACSSGKVQPSHVLKAMGVPLETAQAALRISLGYGSSESDVDRFLEAWIGLPSVLSRAGRNSA